MDKEITKLGLPRGVWQQEILHTIPEASAVNITYPDSLTVQVSVVGPDRRPEFLLPLEIAHFSMSFLYGCKAVLISHGMYVAPEWRNKGIAKRLQPIKKRMAKDLRAAILLATIRADNLPEKNVTKEWSYVTRFTNPRTRNEVEIYFQPIIHEQQELTGRRDTEL